MKLCTRHEIMGSIPEWCNIFFYHHPSARSALSHSIKIQWPRSDLTRVKPLTFCKRAPPFQGNQPVVHISSKIFTNQPFFFCFSPCAFTKLNPLSRSCIFAGQPLKLRFNLVQTLGFLTQSPCSFKLLQISPKTLFLLQFPHFSSVSIRSCCVSFVLA